ncbi:FAD/NAD(P)-binding domain-containing protein [Jaminaea rosea]|uniref:FAD/NAD(P)-binding domain-containing protein n=1 Tax=Jaminaea rosea TaxID=1569628 RepID=A0A316UID3_9BASI|nr:FAD/NAD(P)-binding domain-containing protein [Jaminaea rosea]PWN24979.1 FAD/NAD(P)-binding domain-containing protein [Jaminaea rosea]
MAAASSSSSSSVRPALSSLGRRHLATPVSSGSRSSAHRILVIGGGAAGQAISHQLLRSGAFPNKHDIAIVDPKTTHDYQPGWTLVGGGLKKKEDLRRPMADLAQEKEGLGLYNDAVESFDPDNNCVKTRDGRTLSYEHLIVAPGLRLMPEKVSGLSEAMRDMDAKVASIYDYDSCDRVWDLVQQHRSGPAIFTQPPQPHKCAGAPQKIMWLALDHWKSQGLSRSDIPITYATALPAMFGVPKYAATLEALRKERDVEGLFGHNLVAVNGSTATFAKGEEKVTRPFSLLHAVPPQGPHDFIRSSPLANPTSGFVDVDDKTLRHVKYSNVWSAGDSSSLPTSKTAAAVTSQAPILVNNLLSSLAGTSDAPQEYDGYTSCPIPTEYGKLVLCEFAYNGVPKESFGPTLGIDQAQPSRAFYYLKRDFFPWVYFNAMVKGTWAGPNGWLSAPKWKGAAPSVGGGQARAFSSVVGKMGGSNGAAGRRGFATSARAARDQPSRRPRDPLERDSTAVRYALPGGETLIVRPAPSSGGGSSTGSSATTTTTADPAKILVEEANSEAYLPPALRPRTARKQQARFNSTTPRRTDLSPSEIAEIQALRREGGASVPDIARKFNCSEVFVRIVAPAGAEAKREAQRGMERVRRGEEGSTRFGDLLRREARRARREMW